MVVEVTCMIQSSPLLDQYCPIFIGTFPLTVRCTRVILMAVNRVTIIVHWKGLYENYQRTKVGSWFNTDTIGFQGGGVHGCHLSHGIRKACTSSLCENCLRWFKRFRQRG